MKKLVVKGPIPKTLQNCVVNDFEEEYANYLRTAKKPWRTKEAFSLEFNSTLADLQKSHFIYTDNPEALKRLNIIETI